MCCTKSKNFLNFSSGIIVHLLSFPIFNYSFTIS